MGFEELTSAQRHRYARQISVESIGKDGQTRLCGAKVVIIGCGALGSMVAMQLAGAGVGTLGIADFDTVDISNLQRQFFFKTSEAGKSKVEITAERIKDLNPDVTVMTYGMMTPKNAEKIFEEYDFIVDASDNPETKKMIGELSYKKGKACCIGGVKDSGGQVMTFLPGSPRFEEFFGVSGSEGVLPCSLGGVMGPTAAFCASVQASEAIKYLTGSGDLLEGKVLIFNLRDNIFRVLGIS